jgi:hypothetical protein
MRSPVKVHPRSGVFIRVDLKFMPKALNIHMNNYTLSAVHTELCTTSDQRWAFQFAFICLQLE